MIHRALIVCLKPLLAISLFIGLQQLIELKTRGFCLQKILSTDLPSSPKWQTPPLGMEEEQKIRQLLSQSYHMIGAGSECFAFVSDDGETVIKFFKLDHARPVYFHRGILCEDYSAHAGTLSNHWLTTLCLPPPLERCLKRFLGMREFRIQRTFSSLKLAYDHLPEETGLIYLHLNATKDLHKTLSIYDSCGICHHIDLDTAKFFLQKRATPLPAHFAQLKAQGAHAKAKESIDSLLAMILSRCKKGFADRDVLLRNLGYIGTRAIEIDAGSFLHSPHMSEAWIYKQELFYATLELKEEFKKHYPEMVSYLEQRVSEEIFRGA
jgi:hypothetical protein